jgi:hypothetical protein
MRIMLWLLSTCAVHQRYASLGQKQSGAKMLGGWEK